jgi:hypothetical protein
MGRMPHVRAWPPGRLFAHDHLQWPTRSGPRRRDAAFTVRHKGGGTVNTIHIMGTGHHRLLNGSLLRVDIESGRWVGRLYTPDVQVKTQIVGSDAQVHAWADRIAKTGNP